MMTPQLRDIIDRADTTGGPAYTHFIDPVTAKEFMGVARSLGLSSLAQGGSADAERVLCACFAQGCEPLQWPLQVIHIMWDSRAGDLSHRDVLGAVMGLGIVRDQIGDIRLGDHESFMVAGEQMASYIQMHLVLIGKVHVSVAYAKSMPPTTKGLVQSINLQSLRLDAVLAASIHLSRAKSADLVRSGKVMVNWQEELRPDKEVHIGDMISVRGQGRIKIDTIEGTSRKGRLFLTIESFLGNQ